MPNAVTSIAHLLTTKSISESDLQIRATQALEKLLTVKDPSIQSFIRAFIGSTDSKDLSDDLQVRFDQCLTL